MVQTLTASPASWARRTKPASHMASKGCTAAMLWAMARATACEGATIPQFSAVGMVGSTARTASAASTLNDDTRARSGPRYAAIRPATASATRWSLS